MLVRCHRPAGARSPVASGFQIGRRAGRGIKGLLPVAAGVQPRGPAFKSRQPKDSRDTRFGFPL
jgi:hypothetical protein